MNVNYHGHCPVHPNVDMPCACCSTKIEQHHLGDVKFGIGLWQCNANGHRVVGSPITAKTGFGSVCSICGSTMTHVSSGVFTPSTQYSYPKEK